MTAALAGMSIQASAAVIVVDAAGGGARTQIAAAVAAASNGDDVVVKPGNYTGFSIVDKALDVIGDTNTFNVKVLGQVRVESLSAGTRVQISFLDALGYYDSASTDEDATGVLVKGCAGRVRLQACRFSGDWGSPSRRR